MKKILVVLIVVLITGCFGGEKKEVEKQPKKEVEKEPITCTDYVDSYLADEGWTRTGDVIFTNDQDNNLAWNISSNVFIFLEEPQIQLWINNGQIFVGGNFDNDRFADIKDETNYEGHKVFAETIYEHIDGLGCPLRGKENNILNEEYKTIFIEQ